MNRIRDLREDMDLRQTDVSKATGIDQRTLSNYETGKTNPDSYAIIKLAEFFHESCDYLLGVCDINITDAADISKEIVSIAADISKEIVSIKRRLDQIQKYLDQKSS
jgi:transcriptional regulator with XRE-family HTH domain